MSTLRAQIRRALPRPLRRWAGRWHYLRTVRAFSADRWPEAEGVRRLIRPGDTVADIGANIGYISRLLAEWTGPSGHVLAFEPVPENAEALAWTMRRLSLAQVEVWPVALSDHEGEAELTLPRGEGELYRGSLEPVAGEALRRLRVPVSTLDAQWADRATGPRFLKIDVEGHAEAVLRGARTVLERWRPSLLVEAEGDIGDPSQSAGRIARALAPFGYQPRFWADDRFADEPEEPGRDVFFLPDPADGYQNRDPQNSLPPF